MDAEIKRDIIIWGCGLEGEKFYWTWRHKVNILYAVDARWRTLQRFHGIEVRDPLNKDNLKQRYIIVCANDPAIWNDINGQLQKHGFVEFLDYIRSDLYGNKKLAVLYGNCHMDALEKYLKCNVVFSHDYHTRLYYVNDMDGARFPDDEAMESCDLFIAQDINDRNARGLPSAFELKNKLRKESKSIIIPNVYGMNLYFPQCKKGEFGQAAKLHFEALCISADEKKGKELLRCFDWMNEIWDSNISSREGIKHILDKDTYDTQDIINNVEKEISKLESREESCDVIISDFIRQNYRYQKLFYEPYHPSGAVIKEKGKRILEAIGIRDTASSAVIGEMDSKELPVYASVSKALGLQFECKYIRKSTGNPINIEEYVEHYVEWEIEPCREGDHGADM